MWSNIVGSIVGGSVGGVFGLGESILQNSNNRKLAKTQYNRELALMDKQFENDLEMWNKQNEYNTPLAQMERYKMAGLNPNLIYSQGSSGNATSMPTMTKGSASKPDSVKYNFDFSKLMPFFQMENLNAQNKLINAQTEAATQDALNKGLMNVRYGIENEYLPQKLQKEIDLMGNNYNPLNRVVNNFMDEYGIIGGIIPRIYREEPSVKKDKNNSSDWDWFGK